jgi:hydrogenase maturation protein HypF
MMPGGDKVVYQPWRMVLSILGEKATPMLTGVKRKDKQLVLEMMAKDINSPLTSSAGRLFDAAAALLGVCVKALYEAEGPIKLEAMCDKKINKRYGFKVVKEKTG